MKLIQIILLTSLAGVLILYFRWLRNAAIDKLIVLAIASTAFVFVWLHDLTNKIAAWMGVGRGADLVFYLSFVAFCYIFLLMYSKIRLLEKRIADLTKEVSIHLFKKEEEQQHG